MWDKIIYILYKVMLIIVGYYYWFRYVILIDSYYLVDSGYPIGASFLPSHKATRYHAQKFWRSSRPLDAYFNSDNDDMDIGECGNDMDSGFNGDDMDISDCDDDMNTGVDIDSEYDSEEEDFWFVFLLIGETKLQNS